MPKTGDSRSTALNKFGLQGISPVDENQAQLRDASADGRAGIAFDAPAKSSVRVTHPGRVSFLAKEGGTQTVLVKAADGTVTRYTGLGSVNLKFGDTVQAGQQIGTVAESKGTPVVGYSIFKDGILNRAHEVDPHSAEGARVIRDANGGTVPDPSVVVRQEPPEGDATSEALNLFEEDSDPPDIPTTGPRAPNPLSNFPIVHFVEMDNQVFNHDYLVFINGVDVTNYLVGEISINIADRDGYNEAAIILNNSHDNFVVTADNLGFNQDQIPKFRKGEIAGDVKYSEAAKEAMLIYKSDEGRNPFIDVERAKIAEIGAANGTVGIGVGLLGGSQAVTSTSSQAGAAVRDRQGRQNNQPSTLDRRWQITLQSTVFHKNDPIRIFRRNPLREADEWMPAFTGYLENIKYDTNYVTGASNVRLTCYDIRALVAKMRVQVTEVVGFTNPRVLFKNPPNDSRSLFADLLNPPTIGHPLQGSGFEAVVEFLVTGVSSQDQKLNKAFGTAQAHRGIGDFTVGDRIFFKPGNLKKGISPDPLEHWHHLCLFGMDGRSRQQGGDVVVKGAQKRLERGFTQNSREFNRSWLSEAEARFIGETSTHDGEWAPHKQFVHFLLPAEGTGTRNLLDSDINNVSSEQIDFESRLSILQDFCKRVDYQFWVTPIGDIVFEFPMYDFFPEDFGEYKSVFQIDKHLRSDSIADEAGEIVTALNVSGRLSSFNEANANVPTKVQPRAVILSPMMVIRYGVVEEELALPFITNNDSLHRIGLVEFQKRLANANRMDVDANFRPFLTPNRPIEHMERKRLGLLTAVSNRVELHKRGETSMTARYIRRQVQVPGGVAFTLITGGTSMPISYRQAFAQGTRDIIGEVRGSGAGLGTLNANTGTKNFNPRVGKNVDADGNPIIKNSDALAKTRNIAAQANSPTPSKEQQSRFLAMGAQLSGFDPQARNPSTGGLGIFQMRPEVRGRETNKGAFNIGNSTSIVTQVQAANTYFRSLVGKYTGDFDMAISEFVMGPDKIKNPRLLSDFFSDFIEENKKVAKKFLDTAQSLIFGESAQPPGQSTSTVSLTSSQAKTDGTTLTTPSLSARGFQSGVGVLVVDLSKDEANQ